MATVTRHFITGYSGSNALIRVEGTGFGSTQGSNVLTYNAVPMTITSWTDTIILGTVPQTAVADVQKKFVQLEEVSGPLTGQGGKVIKVSASETQLEYLTLGTAATLNTGTSAGQIPVLDGNGKLVSAIMPSIVLHDSFVVANQTEMLALSCETGDIAVRTDVSKTFILKGSSPAVLADWQELLSPTGFVQSVTGSGSIQSSGGATPVISINDATTSASGAMSATDKTKLDGISSQANKTTASVTNGAVAVDGSDITVYTHPASHAASMIDQDTTHRMVTDTQITDWDSKVPSTHIGSIGSAHGVSSTSVAGFMSSADKTKLDGISAQANKVTASVTNGAVSVDSVDVTVYTHPASHAATMIDQDSTHRMVTDIQTASWDSKAPGDINFDNDYEPKNANIQAHISSALNPHSVTKDQVGLGNVPNVDCTNASNITTGTLPISVMPQGALERLVIVADETARFALTTATAQNGDVVKQSDIGTMFYVKDDTNLANASGYEVFSSSTASAVEWSGVLNTPSTLAGYGITDATPSSHMGATGSAHGNATTGVAGFMSSADKSKLDGISAQANKITSSTTPGNILVDGSEMTVLGLGTTSTTACAGNDTRLSDSRTPSTHATTHVTGGTDIIPNAVAGGNSGLMTGSDKLKLDTVIGPAGMVVAIGSDTFNSTTGVTVNIGSVITDPNYRVAIQPTSNSSGFLGEYWVETKTTTTFVVKNSGASTTATFDWQIIAVTGTPTTIVAMGSGTFNSTTGRVITMGPVLADTNYKVMLQPTSNPSGFLGEYWTESKTTSTFTVKNSGSDNTATFDWTVVR